MCLFLCPFRTLTLSIYMIYNLIYLFLLDFNSDNLIVFLNNLYVLNTKSEIIIVISIIFMKLFIKLLYASNNELNIINREV